MNKKLSDCLAVIENLDYDSCLAAAIRLTPGYPEKTDPLLRIRHATALASRHLVEEVRELRAACAAVIEAEDGTEESEMDAAVTLCRAALRA